MIFCVCFLLFDITINPHYQHVADSCNIACIYRIYLFFYLVPSSFLTIINQAAMNIFYKSLLLYIYLVHPEEEWLVSCRFSFKINCLRDFQSDITIYNSVSYIGSSNCSCPS